MQRSCTENQAWEENKTGTACTHKKVLIILSKLLYAIAELRTTKCSYVKLTIGSLLFCVEFLVDKYIVLSIEPPVTLAPFTGCHVVKVQFVCEYSQIGASFRLFPRLNIYVGIKD